MSSKLTIRQLTIYYTRIDDVRLLTKSCRTYTYIKYSVIKNYHLKEMLLDISGS